MPFQPIGQFGPQGVIGSARGAWVRQQDGGYLFERRGVIGPDAELRSSNFSETDGTGWRLGGNTHGFFYYDTLYFTSSGTFDKADYPGLRAVRAIVQGGGGGGGGMGSQSSSSVGAATGGSGGGYSEKFILVDALGASETVTVGAGGGQGSNGNTSSFGSHCTGNAGQGGGGATSTGTSAINGPGGGSGTGGDLNIQGGDGGRRSTNGSANRAFSGQGGDSVLGSGGARKWVDGAGAPDGVPGRGYGAGGSGGAASNSTGGAAGGAGTDGIVLVELYY